MVAAAASSFQINHVVDCDKKKYTHTISNLSFTFSLSFFHFSSFSCFSLTTKSSPLLKRISLPDTCNFASRNKRKKKRKKKRKSFFWYTTHFQRQTLMSSVFVPENSGSPQQQKQPEQARPKRPRSSLAVSFANAACRKTCWHCCSAFVVARRRSSVILSSQRVAVAPLQDYLVAMPHLPAE